MGVVYTVTTLSLTRVYFVLFINVFPKETDEISGYALIIPLLKSQIVQKMYNK